MGRPPIGKTAMTGAERTRRYRLKRAPAKPVSKPNADSLAKVTALETELAKRDRRIKTLATENQRLKEHILDLLELSRDRSGSMNFATQSAIAKCLHPDYAPSEADRAAACRLFTAWKADSSKARRKS